jgi:hypothetical protein
LIICTFAYFPNLTFAQNPWLEGGNTIPTFSPITQSNLGTLTNYPINFFTNNVERMNIFQDLSNPNHPSSGFIGLNLANGLGAGNNIVPSERLTINGSIKFVQDQESLGGRKVEWLTSDWGSGYGHKWYDENGPG